MALQQLNLKVPEAVATHWRVQAAAHGLSVRDWLMSMTAPTAQAAAVPATAELLERLEALERTTAELAAALEAQAPRRPRPPRAAPAEPPAGPAAPLPPPADLPSEGIETGALANLLGLRRPTLNARISRAGGARVGLELHGWRCCGLARPARGGPPRALWVPAAS